MEITDLKDRAAWVRQELWKMTMRLQRGHLPSCYSMVDILVALYYHHIMRFPRNRVPEGKLDYFTDDPERDRLIISKGHGAAALYPILADCGYFPMEELKKYGKPGGLLGVFADHAVPGIEAVSDSLGHGLGIGAGMALAAKRNKEDHRVFVILGDAELNEGSCWEAAAFAGHYKLDNLIAIVDNNGLGILGATIGTGDLATRWKSHGWSRYKMDGHRFDMGIPAGILDTLDAACYDTWRGPRCIIADTIKGKGISFMEGKSEWHNKMPTPEQQLAAEIELGIGIG